MNTYPFRPLIRTLYKSLLILSTLILLASCGSSSGSSSSNSNDDNNGDYTPTITLPEKSAVEEGSKVEFVISVSTTNPLQSSINGILTLTFSGSAAEEFNATTTLFIDTGENTENTTLVPNPNNNESKTTKQFTVSIDNISVTNMTTITLTIPDDDIVETTETLTITVDNIRINGIDYSENIGMPSTNIAIVDDDAYELSISKKQDGNEEGETNAEFIVSVSPTNESGSTITGTIKWDWEGSTAEESDFKTSSFLKSFSIPNGTSKTTIALPAVKNDDSPEGTESVIAQIIEINSGEYRNRISTATASVDIIDDDAYTLDIAATPNEVAEGNDIAFTISVSPTNTSGAAITGTLTWGGSTDESDFTNSLPNEFSIDEGQIETTFSLTVVDDDEIEKNKTLMVTLSRHADDIFLGATTTSVDIIDDDAYTLDITATQDEVIEGSDVAFTISVSPTNTSGVPITGTLDFTGSAAKDFNTTTFSITISKNSTTITLPVPDDDEIEKIKELIATISEIQTNGYNYNVERSSAMVTIKDNDAYELSISKKQDGNEEGETNAEFIVSVSPTNESGATITGTIEWDLKGSTAEESDFKTSSFLKSFSIPNGTSKTTITLPAVKNDDSPEGTESVIAQIIEINSGEYRNRISTATASVDIIDNDAYTLDIAATPNEVAEGNNIAFTISVSTTNTSGAAITGTLTWGGSADENDFNNPFPTTFYIDNGQSSTRVILTVVNNDIIGKNKTLMVTLSRHADDIFLGATTASVDIIDDDEYTLDITATQDEVIEGSDVAFTISVSPTNTSGAAITGTLTWGGSADELDFTNSLPNEFSIADGQSKIIFSLTVKNDDLVESSETLKATIEKIDSNGYNHNVESSSATVTISDNDFYTLSIEPKQDGREGGDPAEFTISLLPANQSDSTITGHIAISSDSIATEADISNFKEMFSIAGGESTTTITLAIADDKQVESTETLTLTLEGIVEHRFQLSATTASVDIIDNDAYTLSITANQNIISENEVSPDIEFVISLSSTNQSGSTITGSITVTGTATTDDFDLISTNGEFPTEFSIASGQIETTFSLTVKDDDLIESTETLTATIVNINSGDDASEISIAKAIVTISDNDQYVFRIETLNNPTESDSDSVIDLFLVTVSPENNSGGDLVGSITYGGDASTADYTIDSTEFNIPDGQSTFTIEATILGDNIPEFDKRITAELSRTAPRDGVYSPTANAATATISDDDKYEISIVHPRNGSEDGTTAQFTVRVSPINQTGSTITGQIDFSHSTANKDDFDLINTNGEFPTEFSIADGKSEIMIRLAVKDDQVKEITETLKATIHSIDSGNYRNEISTASVSIDIIDNDAYTLSITANQNIISENEVSPDIEFVISLSSTNQSGSTITGSITVTGTATTDDFDLISTNGEFPTEFSIANGKRKTIIKLTVVDDTEMEKTEKLEAVISFPASTSNTYFLKPSSVSVDIIDNDAYTLSITANQNIISENEVSPDIEFVISLSSTNQSGSTITGSITVTGTATTDDFDLINTNGEFPTEFSIANGKRKTIIKLTVVDDTEIEKTEKLEAIISFPASTSNTYFLKPSSASVSIEDNDQYVFRIETLTNPTESDSDSVIDLFLVTVSPENNSGGDLVGSITYGGDAGTADYTIDSTEFNIPDGQSTFTIEATILGDNIPEFDKRITAELSRTAPRDGVYSPTANAATATISDDDKYEISIVHPRNGSEDGTTAQFTIRVSPTNQSGSTITGSITVTGTATTDDFDLSNTNGEFPKTFIILDGQSETVIEFTVVDDDLAEEPETLMVSINDVSSNNGYGVIVGSHPTASATISSDDYELNIIAEQNGIEDGAKAKFTISVSPTNKSGETISGEIKFSGTATIGDFTDDVFPSTFTIPNTQKNFFIELTVSHDGLDEGSETLIAEINKIPGTNNFDNPVSASVTIIDKDRPEPDITKFSSSHPKLLEITWRGSDDYSFYRINEGKDGNFEVIDTTNSDNYSTPVSLIGPNRVSTHTQYFIEGALESQADIKGKISVLSQTDINKLIGYFKGSNTDSADVFGYSVALSTDGETLAVGAIGESSTARGVNGKHHHLPSAYKSGAVYVFTLENNIWKQTAYIKASNADSKDEFGTSVALSNDGKTLAVGAPYEDSTATGINGNQGNEDDEYNSGAVYVFTLDSTWTQTAYIKASNADFRDEFGRSVALSANGKILAVGSPKEYLERSSPTNTSAGAVYVFTLDSTWTETAYLKASNVDPGDEFGHSVALSGEGTILAVGSPKEDSNSSNSNENNNEARDSGAVYIFTFENSAWREKSYLKASNADGGLDLSNQPPGDSFGFSIALSNDGITLAVGAPYEDSNAIGTNQSNNNDSTDTGAVYVFTFINNDWYQTKYIKASNTGEGDQFGYSVDLSGDGTTLAVGAIWENSNGEGINGDQNDGQRTNKSGAVYLFTGQRNTWTQKTYLKASNPDSLDRFGESVTLNGDGTTLAIGAIFEDGNTTGINTGVDKSKENDKQENSGAVYLY